MSTALVTIDTAREQFLANRKRFIGGSDSASLFAADSVYGCDTRLFFDKSGVPPDYPRTQREENILNRGNVWEEIVATYFQEETGLKIRRIGSRTSKELPQMGVNMDRQIIGMTTEQLKALWPDAPDIQAMTGECGPGYLECKTTNEWMFKQMMTPEGGMLVDYIYQVNHGLAVTNYKWGVFAVLEPTWGQFATFPFVYMPALGEEQKRRTAEFWERLQAGEMPQPKVNDKRCKTCLWRRSCPRSAELKAEADKEFMAEGYVADDSLAELVSDYREAKDIAEQKQETVDLIKAKLQQAIGTREKVEVPSCGVRISWSKTKPPMRWDANALVGTAQVLAKTDIPKEAVCEEIPDFDANQRCGKAAMAVVEHKGLLYYACDICAPLAAKRGNTIVARKGVSEMVMNCRRAGEPSRPFKFLTL